ncbi:MAG TPA: small basic protein [Candidatus Margulisiibacteriota bacterium]|nr:small basic protein [Candidatus Margulisiibacteriota bacterium]
MSIHPSLASSDKDKKQRSVLKRTERIRTMMEKGHWKEGDDVYGLPKIKTIRIKIKKEKVEKAAAEGAPAEGAAAAPAATKEQAPTKGAATKK